MQQSVPGESHQVDRAPLTEGLPLPACLPFSSFSHQRPLLNIRTCLFFSLCRSPQ